MGAYVGIWGISVGAINIREQIALCHKWWDGGGRSWQKSVDEPADIPHIQAMMVAEWVVSLDNAKVEVMDSGVSGVTKGKIKHVCEGVVLKWLEGVDLGLLNV